MARRIGAIKESSDRTARIIKTIDEIAFQTNLLALNAAVEAARAGNAGRGFAVVAEEVRSLALRSAQAAKDTSSMIEESQHRAEQGVSASREVQELLQRIRGNVEEAGTMVREVAAASREQSRGVEQITQAVSQMDQVTQSNAASAEENAAASEELSAQATSLRDTVRTLSTLVMGRNGPSGQRALAAGGDGAPAQIGHHERAANTGKLVTTIHPTHHPLRERIEESLRAGHEGHVPDGALAKQAEATKFRDM
jgi:methyl-accepting chemotaxis protein